MHKLIVTLATFAVLSGAARADDCADLSTMVTLSQMTGDPAREIQALRYGVCSGRQPDASRLSWSNGYTAKSSYGTWSYPNGYTAKSSYGTWSYPNGYTAKSSYGTWSYPNGYTAKSSYGTWSTPKGMTTTPQQIIAMAWERDPRACHRIGPNGGFDRGLDDLTLLQLGWLAR